VGGPRCGAHAVLSQSRIGSLAAYAHQCSNLLKCSMDGSYIVYDIAFSNQMTLKASAFVPCQRSFECFADGGKPSPDTQHFDKRCASNFKQTSTELHGRTAIITPLNIELHGACGMLRC